MILRCYNCNTNAQDVKKSIYVTKSWTHDFNGGVLKTRVFGLKNRVFNIKIPLFLKISEKMLKNSKIHFIPSQLF